MEKKVSTDHLKLGMFVSQLDRPWMDTPFLFQGFAIQSDDDIAQLQNYCKHVTINPELGESADQYLDNEDDAANSERFKQLFDNPIELTTYQEIVPVEEEFEAAKESHSVSYELVNSIMDDVQSGKRLNPAGIEEAVDQMVDSVLRNPDALVLLTQMKRNANYDYSHAINASTLAISFGRYLGLAKHDLKNIATGTMLFDVGKMKLPQDILQRPDRLTSDEFELIKKHVGFSAALMHQTKGFDLETINVVMAHHERHSGKGYPRGLAGTQIPVYGRIAAIVDCYDAITSNRPHARAMSPHEAVRKLYDWRGVDFQEDMVEQFIQCLGVYPTGTVVELSSGDVGIVLAQNKIRRLRPKVMLVVDSKKQPYPSPQTINLDTMIEDSAGQPLEILQSLEPGAYNIDPAEFYL